ncbi:MAG: nucleotidyl transferase AbiEii/AbiGii toxin family protein [Bacteroidota bacterium]
MISERCFSKEWLESFRKEQAHQKIDQLILEKMIYALHLVERLKTNGLEFIFKGGTSLILLLEKGNRFSIDIDIVSTVSREKLEDILNDVINTSRFSTFQLDTLRSYKVGVPKAHYIFSFESAFHSRFSGKILLDILIEENLYPEVISKPISTKWIQTEREVKVMMPSVDSITGDKLTAFAPNTVGIPYEKKGQSCSMEMCKQLFDLGKLFDKLENIETVAESFFSFANREIMYRESPAESFPLTPELVLRDTIDTCVIIAKRGKGTQEEKVKFSQLQAGIRAFGSSFLMEDKFRIEDAITAAGKVAYLAGKIMKSDYTPLEKYEPSKADALMVDDQRWNFLNRLRKLPDTSGFFYWYQALPFIS